MNNKKFIAFGIIVMQLVIKPAFGMQQDSPSLQNPGLQKGNLPPLGGEPASRGLTDSPQTVQASRSESGPVSKQRRMTVREELEKQKEESKKAQQDQKKTNPQATGVNGLIVGSPKSYTDQKFAFQLEQVVKKDDPKNIALRIWAEIRNKKSLTAVNIKYSIWLRDHQLKAAIMLGNFQIIPHEQRSYLLINISNYLIVFSDDGEWIPHENTPLFIKQFIKKDTSQAKQKDVCKEGQEEVVVEEEEEEQEEAGKKHGKRVFEVLDRNGKKTRKLLSDIKTRCGITTSLSNLKQCVIFHYPASTCIGIKIRHNQEIFLSYDSELLDLDAINIKGKTQVFLRFEDEEDELQFAMDDLTLDEEEARA